MANEKYLPNKKSMNNFGSTAQKLARNPLGLVALFLVLIYGIACLTFGFAKNLPKAAPMCFVVFIILYPLIVLFVFYRLVTKHHTKLYAPQDFQRPGDFLACAYGDQDRGLTKEQVTSAPAISPTIELSSRRISITEGEVPVETPKSSEEKKS